MAENLRTSVVVDLTGNLQRRAQRYSRSMDRMSKRGSRAMLGLSRAAGAAGRGIDRLGNRYTALITGAGGIAAAREVVNLDKRLTRLGSDANASAGQMEKLKKQIFELAMDPKIRAGTGEIIGVLEELIERTGDMDFAAKNLRTFATALQSSGARGRDIGGVAAELQKMGMAPDEVARSMEILTIQGEKGAFTMAKLAREAPRVFSAYASLGRTGVPAIQELGASLQSMMKGIGKTEVTATAFEALLRKLTEKKVVDTLRAGGIQVFDPEALARGEERLRPINVLMKEIVERAGGRKSLLNELFGGEAGRAFNEIAKGGEAMQLLEDLAKESGDTTRMTDRAARNAGTAAAAMTSLHTAFQKFADDNLSEPISTLANLINALDQTDWERIGKTLKWGAIAFGGALFARKGFQAVQTARGVLGRGAGGALGGGSMQSPIPVFVVNKGFGGRGGAGRRAAAGRAGRLARGAAALAPAAGAVGLAGAAGYGAGTLVRETALKGTSADNVIGRTVAMIMAGLGSDAADRALRAEAERVGRERAMEGELKITVEDKRVRVDSMRGSGMEMDVDTGPMMGGG